MNVAAGFGDGIAATFGHHQAMAEGAEERFGNERARLLATLSGSLVHEVANRVGALIGLAEALGSALSSNEQQQLETAAAATRASIALLRRVVQLLDRGPRTLQPTSLVTAVHEAAALVSRHAQRQSGATIVVRAEGDPIVRLDVGELLQIVATALLFVQRHGDGGPITIAIGSGDAPRPGVAVRMATTGNAAAFAGLATALAGDIERCVPGLLAAGDGSDALLFAVAILRRRGGDLRVEVGSGPECALAIVMPVLR